MVQTTNQTGSESYSGKKIPRSKIRTGSIPVAGTATGQRHQEKGYPEGYPFSVCVVDGKMQKCYNDGNI